jgi:uncharacterized paraquat-inducible protein A
MDINIFGYDLDISIKGIINFIINNRVAFIPIVIYMVLNKLIPIYIIIIIIIVYFMLNQLEYNDKIKMELNNLKNK